MLKAVESVVGRQQVASQSAQYSPYVRSFRHATERGLSSSGHMTHISTSSLSIHPVTLCDTTAVQRLQPHLLTTSHIHTVALSLSPPPLAVYVPSIMLPYLMDAH